MRSLARSLALCSLPFFTKETERTDEGCLPACLRAKQALSLSLLARRPIELALSSSVGRSSGRGRSALLFFLAAVAVGRTDGQLSILQSSPTVTDRQLTCLVVAVVIVARSFRFICSLAVAARNGNSTKSADLVGRSVVRASCLAFPTDADGGTEGRPLSLLSARP